MSQRSLALTDSTRRVLAALVAEPARDQHATDLRAATGLGSGRLYPVLARLESLQWVDSGWEAWAEHHDVGWPRRRRYRLNSTGLAMARGMLASERATSAQTAQRLRPAPETS